MSRSIPSMGPTTYVSCQSRSIYLSGQESSREVRSWFVEAKLSKGKNVMAHENNKYTHVSHNREQSTGQQSGIVITGERCEG
jgi:hypothetical protein